MPVLYSRNCLIAIFWFDFEFKGKFIKINCGSSGVTKSMVIPGPETEAIGESGSGGVGDVPPDAEKSLPLKCNENCLKL